MDRNEEAVSGHLSTATYPNKYNVVIPLEAPFFRTGIKVLPKGGTQPLIEGLDYYLGYYYQEAAESFEEAIYGGIILLNTAEIEYEIVPVGHEYRIPSSEIGKWLVAVDIKDPRNVDWSSLMRYAPTIPAIDPPQDLEEARQRDDVVAALYELCSTLQEQAVAMDGAYTACVEELLRTGKKIYEDGLYQHHLIPNVHPYTGTDMDGNDDGIPDVNGTGTYARSYGVWEATYSEEEFNTLLQGGTVPEGVLEATVDAGNCLMVGAKAADATLAFGRTFNQLVTLMSTSGIQQRDIDALMDTTLGHLYGRMAVENGDTLTYKTANDNHIIEIHNGSILLKTKFRMELAADRDSNESGVAAEVSAGLNSLMVHSGANVTGPVYNGAFLITPDQVSTYLHEVTLNAANAYMTTTPTVTVYGNGKSVSPFQLQATPPSASPTVEGLLAVTDSPTPTPLPSTALSQAAVTRVRDDLALYVDDTFTINGVTFNPTTQTITLTKANMGLGNANNTAASDKPVSTALAAALVLKSLLTHTHTINDVNNKPTASGTVAGMLQLQDSVDTNATRAITSRQGFLVDADIDALELKSGALMPAWSIIGQQYGKPGFMPIPARGNYEGFSRTMAHYAALRKEENHLYVLRNAWNGIAGLEAVYYTTIEVNSNNTITNMVPTSFKYTPQGLVDKYPGVQLKEVLFASSDAGLFLGKDGNYYVVVFNGTADYRKHTTVARVIFDNIVDADLVSRHPYVSGYNMDIVVHNDDVYITSTVLNASITAGGYRSILFRIPKESIATPLAHAQVTPLTGSRFKFGDWNAFFRDGGLQAAEDPDYIGWADAAAVAKWSVVRNLTHGTAMVRTAARKGDLYRVGSSCSSYLATPVTSSFFQCWFTSYLIDLKNRTIVLESEARFPMRIGEAGPHYKDETTLATANGAKLAGHGVNSYTSVIDAGDSFFTFYVGTTSVSPARVFSQPHDPQYTLFDYAKFDFPAPINPTSYSLNVEGGEGSVYANAMSHPLFLDGGAKSMLLTQCSNHGYCIQADYVTNKTYEYPGQGGLGPSNNRRMVARPEYEALANMCLVKTGKNDPETLDGAKWTGPGSFRYRNVPGSSTTQAKTISISQAAWDGLFTAVKDTMRGLSGSANGYAKEYLEAAEAAIAASQPGSVLMALYTFGVDAFGGSPLVLAVIGVQSPRNGVNALDMYVFGATATVDGGGVITFPVPNVSKFAHYNSISSLVDNGLWRGTNNADTRISQQVLCSSDGASYFVFLPSVFTVRVPGNTSQKNWYGKLTKTGNSWGFVSGGHLTDTDWNSPNRIAYVRDLGGFVRYSFNLGNAILSGALYDYDDWIAAPYVAASTGNVVLASMDVATGWIMYITEEVYFYVKQTPILLPVFELDLESAFPGQNANQTFYVHVEGYQDAGTWKGRYVVGLTQLADTDTLLYIGTVKTDTNRITAIDLSRVKRLGRVRSLIEHSLDPNLHLTSERLSKHFSPLDGVAALPLDPAGNSATGYLSLLKAAKQAPKTPHFLQVPVDPMSGSWYSPDNPADKFWVTAPAAALAVAGTNPEANALGMINIGFGPKLQALEKFGHKVKVTTTSPTLRMRVSVDDNVQIRIDGLVHTPGTTPNLSTVTVIDKALTPGEHVVSFEVGEGPGFSPCYLAYILYDYDGTTERELARSNAASKVGIVSPVLERHKVGCVISAATMRFTGEYTVLNVTNRRSGAAMPYVTEKDGSDTLVHYPMMYYPIGAVNGVVVSPSDAVVNLMST